MIDAEDVTELVTVATRWFQAEFKTAWPYTQIGLLIAIAALAWLISAAIRHRLGGGILDKDAPAPFRLLERVLVGNLGMAVFALLA